MMYLSFVFINLNSQLLIFFVFQESDVLDLALLRDTRNGKYAKIPRVSFVLNTVCIDLIFLSIRQKH